MSLNTDKISTLSAEYTYLSNLSWIPYARVLISMSPLIFISLVLLIAYDIFEISVIILSFSFAAIIYQFLMLRSVKIVMNSDGIWCFSGFLPWNRGGYGIRWRDLGGASCGVGFFSWLTKSHSVYLLHRFTQNSQVTIHNVRNGDQVINIINEQHQNNL